jgi:hypothetical protein
MVMEVASEGALKDILQRDAFADDPATGDASGNTKIQGRGAGGQMSAKKLQELDLDDQLVATVNDHTAKDMIDLFMQMDAAANEFEAMQGVPEEEPPPEVVLHQIGWARKVSA